MSDCKAVKAALGCAVLYKYSLGLQDHNIYIPGVREDREYNNYRFYIVD
jgi:hypothetical protein